MIRTRLVAHAAVLALLGCSATPGPGAPPDSELPPRDAVDLAQDAPEDTPTTDRVDVPAPDTITRDTGALPDTGAPTDTGSAPDTGHALDSSAPDTGSAMDTGRLDTGAFDTGALDTGALDTGALDTGSAMDTGRLDTGVPDTGALDTGAFDTGVMDARCPTVAAPPPDPEPWSIALPGTGPATTRTVTSGTHRDLYLSGPGGVAELGVRLDWGGSVVFFGQTGMPGSNVIDANDTGRELQLALYDPQRLHQACAWNASCAGTSPCGNSITYLGWDPVQGGDECNHGARVLRSGAEGERMVVSVRPLQWNPDWDAMDCRRSACGSAGVEVGVTYHLAFRFVHPNVVEVTMELASEETLDHRPTAQEFPTLYVGHGAPGTDLPHLLDSEGNRIAVDQPANDGFTTRTFGSPGGWVSWQHAARDYGVGLAMDNHVTQFQGWEGDGGRAPYFHNVRPVQVFGLPPRGTVRGRAYLTLGSFETVRALHRSVLARRPPFGHVDVPAEGTIATPSGGSLRVAGWALDNAAGVTLRARVDGRDAGELPRTASRPDVCAVYPLYPGCPSVGFDLALPWGAADGCVHTLELLARDADGNETVLARRLVRGG